MAASLSPQQIFDDFTRFGEMNTNPAVVEKYARYFREGYDAFGLAPGLVDERVNEILALPGFTRELMVETSLLLVGSPKYELPAAAFKLMLGFQKQWTAETFKTVEQWFSLGITNWAHTDYICGELMNLFFKKKLITIEDLNSWRTAGNRFQRRAAVVSLIKPMKTSADFDPFFRFIDPMMHDPERVVHQGLGWLLREMWKKQPIPTKEFLMRYKNTAPRLIFQYATEKMTVEGKGRFRRENG
jgi:3-methyladenine DNA glycosylase AlkD